MPKTKPPPQILLRSENAVLGPLAAFLARSAIDPALNETDAQGEYKLLIFDCIAVSIGCDLDGPAIKVPGGSILNRSKGVEL